MLGPSTCYIGLNSSLIIPYQCEFRSLQGEDHRESHPQNPTDKSCGILHMSTLWPCYGFFFMVTPLNSARKSDVAISHVLFDCNKTNQFELSAYLNSEFRHLPNQGERYQNRPHYYFFQMTLMRRRQFCNSRCLLGTSMWTNHSRYDRLLRIVHSVCANSTQTHVQAFPLFPVLTHVFWQVTLRSPKDSAMLNMMSWVHWMGRVFLPR